MTLGTSIFLSVVILSTVILFVMTMDRWNWKRIVRWVVFLTLGLVVIFAVTLVGIYISGDHPHYRTEERSKLQTEFFGIPLRATVADVKFTKGEPSVREGEDHWIYRFYKRESYYAKMDSVSYLVQFRNKRVRYISFISNTSEGYWQIGQPFLLGFGIGSTYKEVQKKLGEPTNISTSSDDLGRIYSYDKLNVFFVFAKSSVYGYGIFDPREGPIKFLSEKSTPSNAK